MGRQRGFTGEPPSAIPDLVGLRVDFEEMGLRQKMKAVGAKWDPGRRLWLLRRDARSGSACKRESPHRPPNKWFMLFEACI